MAKFMKAIARGLKAMAEGRDAPVGDPFTVAGKAVCCGHCGHDRFEDGRVQFIPPSFTLVRRDWVHTLTCSKCGRVELFRSGADSLD